jgi:hypothetical protein
MKKFISLFWAVCIALPLCAQVKINIPDLKGYVTLKCDFHIHTAFSHDGVVWPTGRVEEAYREGLDAIALTDHIEGFKFKEGSFASRNKPYEVAEPFAKSMGIILINGGERAWSMPPGEFNSLFLTDVNELDKPDYMDGLGAAKAQNAFIFWNHPGLSSWYAQPDTTLWWPDHTKIWENGMMHGIEVVNSRSYYPEAHRWCLEKKLTMLGNSDAHWPYQSEYAGGVPRVMTLVFAQNATAEGIREALFDRRTAILFGEYVIGEEKYLKELFENALEWNVWKNDKEMYVTVKNKSDLTFRLKKTNPDPRVVYFRNTSLVPYTIIPQGEQTFAVRLSDDLQSADVSFIVENFIVEPNEGMNYSITVRK